ncbi:MAG: hypothetical protein M3441_18170 [Chloroflexota bacterium]|nr:hypothetical protein [Chloroflexota bacterium]
MSQQEKDISSLDGGNEETPGAQNAKPILWRRLLLPIAGAFVLAVVAMLLATQFRGSPTLTPQAGEQVTSPISADASVHVRPTVAVALPTAPPGAPLRFERHEKGYRLYADRGVVYYGSNSDPWVGPNRLLVTWLAMAFDRNRVHDAYVLNLESGALEQLPGYEVQMTVHASKDGSRVALLDPGNGRVLLSDLLSGEVSKIYDREATAVQWAGEDVHPKDVGKGKDEGRDESDDSFSFERGNVTWVSPDAFVVEMYPGIPPAQRATRWAKTFLLVDVPNKRAHLLPTGFLEGALPDGTILLSQDSLDGTDLFAIQPPYTGEPVQVSEPGVWIISLAVSPDRTKVAWLEAQPEAENLPHQHAMCFEGCRFKPTPKAIAIWEPRSGQLKRIPLDDGPGRPGLYLFGMYLAWSTDNTSIFYHTLVDSGHVGLYKLAPDARAEELVRAATRDFVSSGVPHLAGITFFGEADDGSVYYSLPDDYYKLMRRNSDGTSEVVADPVITDRGVPAVVNSWLLDESGHILILNEDGVTIIDIASGEQQKVSFPAQQILEKVFEPSPLVSWPFSMVRISPDGRWLAYAGWDTDQYQYFSLEGLPDEGLVLRVMELK